MKYAYRLLESQLLRLSHSICFDDEQVNVYSSELADIINSACVKIESLAKDISLIHSVAPPFQTEGAARGFGFGGKTIIPGGLREKSPGQFVYNFPLPEGE